MTKQVFQKCIAVSVYAGDDEMRDVLDRYLPSFAE